MVKYSIEISDLNEAVLGPKLIERLMEICNDWKLSLVISYKNFTEIKEISRMKIKKNKSK